VVHCCEDDLTLVKSFDSATNQCRFTSTCALTGIAQEALDASIRVFDKYTLAGLAVPKSRLVTALGMEQRSKKLMALAN
jgi:Rrf2 family nitric oxide-sensitive transcriptional repressor